ncbi:MAG TPA: hypothetical protein VFU43_22410 [Streptosporangiaceae bacterium]|nr:hypothetical protein [Streptosporangiaceae bacterium]
MSYLQGVTYFLADTGLPEEFPGVPYPRAGVRVAFDIDKFVAGQGESSFGAPNHPATDGAGLVVHEDPINVESWPCRLWRVDDLVDVVRLAPSNRWLRCGALTVYEELPGWLVMGPRGHAVVAVIEQARALTNEKVRAIAAIEGREEQDLYKALWDRWLRTHEAGSPVGSGLSAVSRAVEEAARQVGDESLFVWDEEDEVEVLADPAWRHGRQAALAAALSVGAPDVLDASENEELAKRWRTIVGLP